MEIDIAFFDEFGRPIQLGPWPGETEKAPERSGFKPNVFKYTHEFMRDAGYTLTRSDTVAQLKKTLIKITPYLTPKLAIGRIFNKIKCGGRELQDKDKLANEVTLDTKQGKINSHDGGFSAEMVLSITVTLLDRRQVSMTFDEMTVDQIKVRDMTEMLAEGMDMPLKDLYLVRTYPTLRPVVFHNDQLLMGFEGVMKKGLWEETPYPGPVQPATIPTPPDMKFRVVKKNVFDYLHNEEELWNQMNEQCEWRGHVETMAGGLAPCTLALGKPAPTQFYKVTHGGKTVITHSRRITPLNIGGVRVGSPDKSYINGECHFVKSATVSKLTLEMFGTELYLPGQDLIERQGKDYIGYEKGVSFGEGVIKTAEFESPLRYKIAMTDGAGDVKAIMTMSTVIDKTEYVWEGELVKETKFLAYRGKHWCAPKFSANKEGDHTVRLATSFCMFQLTIGGHLPSVVSTAIGKRFANLSTRSFWVFKESADGGAPVEEQVSAGNQVVKPAEFVASLGEEPRIVFAVCKTEAAHAPQSCVILWNAHTADRFTFGMSKTQMDFVMARQAIVLNADSLETLQAAVHKSKDLKGDTLVSIGAK